MKRSGVVIPHSLDRRGRFAAKLVYGTIRGLASTTRFSCRDEAGLAARTLQAPGVFCIWHNRLAFSLIIYRRFIQPHGTNRRLAALVSASKDGAFLAGVLQNFGVQPVRGSSSRRGSQAMLELTSWLDRGYDIAITPDGPRGPRYVAQDGAIALAQVTGAPLVPVSCVLTPKISLNSWDRFQIPVPFGRCDVTIGPALLPSRDLDEAGRAAIREELQRRLGGGFGESGAKP